MSEDEQMRALWAALDEVGLITGAWSGMSIGELPPEVRERFEWAVREAMGVTVQ